MHDAWWTLILFAVIGVAVLVTAVSFTGSLRSTVPVTLTADRSGLVMDSGAKVMMRGVQVGRVAQIGRIEWAQNGASLRLEIDPEVAERLAAGHTLGDLHLPQDGGDVGVGHHTSPSLTSSSASVRDRSQAYGWVWGYGRDSESNEK